VLSPPAISAKKSPALTTTAPFPPTRKSSNTRPREGRFFSDAENAHRADVAVIGPDVAQTLYPDNKSIGKPILVDTVTYEVIGVLEPRKGQLVKDSPPIKTSWFPIAPTANTIPRTTKS